MALLALQPGPQSRRRLAGTLWPEDIESRAGFYLRRTLMELRKRLGSHAAALAEPDEPPSSLLLTLPTEACDLWLFDRALRTGDDLTAVSLYQGPLLEGWDEDWVLGARAQRQQLFLGALERLAMQAQTSHDAIAQLQRLVALDPGRESAWRALMQALADRGDPAALVQAYRELRHWLRREVRLEPSAETVACYQRLRSEARQKSPPVQTLRPTTPRYALPLAPTPLVGRHEALTELSERLETTRLLTLVGMGGVGKTRLALATLETHQADPRFAEGVAWVDLAALTDPALVPARLASVLGIPEQTALSQALAQRRLLLCLDNCEHVLEAVAQLAEQLLSTCPNLHLLATSREPLGLAQETLWRVPPLSDEEALLLFEARARKALPHWKRTQGNTPLIQQLCTRLDDLPFAIELAAAQLASLPLEELVRRLGKRFELLSGGSRSALRRQQTLRATMDWSWERLTLAEQETLQQLAIFVSPFSLAEAEAASPGNLHALSSLVAKSLVDFASETGQYRLLETVREYVLQRDTSEVGQSAREGYLGYVCEQIQQLRGATTAQARRAHYDRLESSYDNIRLLLSYAQKNYPDKALKLASLLWPFWWERGHWQEGYRVLTEVLPSRDESSSPTYPYGLLGAGVLSYELGDYPGARGYLEQAKALAQRREETWVEGEALRVLGLLRWNEGFPEEARALYQESLTCFQREGHTAGQANVLANLGHLTWNLGNLQDSLSYNLNSRALYQSLNDEAGLAETSAQLGLVARSQDDYESARSYFEESLALRRQLGFRSGIVTVLHHLGVLAYLERRYDDAEVRLRESMELWRELGDPGWLALSLYYLGLVQRAQRAWPEAIRTLTEALLLRRKQGARRSIAGLQYALGTIWLEQGRLEDARIALQESAQLRYEIGLPVFCGEALDVLACLYVRQGNLAQAVRHLACGAHLREGLDEIESEHPHRDEATKTAQTALSPEDWQQLWEEGRTLLPHTL